MQKGGSKQLGFTIVELLIVIVIIAILATIVLISYSKVTASAQDTKRKGDITTIAQALELYYLNNGRYPPAGGSTAINPGWSTTADASWGVMKNLLVPKYAESLPEESQGKNGISPLGGTGRGYAYYTTSNSTGSSYCGSFAGQMYLLVYRLSASSQEDTFLGDCTSSPLSYGGNSNYRVVK